MSYPEKFGFDKNFDITKPLYDQSSFYGRYQHFKIITDTWNLFYSKEHLLECKIVTEKFRSGTLDVKKYSKEDIIKAKILVDSSFHPDSGDYQTPMGRMSSQTLIGAMLSGGMLAFYKTNIQVLSMQWINQSCMALVNYTNRNAKHPMSNSEVLTAYLTATGSAIVAAIGFRKYFMRVSKNPLLLRFVPYIAVASANCVNIPLMRQSELLQGVACFDDKGEELCTSKFAALKSISQTVLGRVLIPLPSLTIAPVIMQYMEQIPRFQSTLKKKPVSVLVNFLLTFAFLYVSVPMGCALFPQRCSMKLNRLQYLDSVEYARVAKQHNMDFINSTTVYFNKGL